MTQREEFEAEARALGLSIDRMAGNTDQYLYRNTRDAWHIWRAAQAASTDTQMAPADPMDWPLPCDVTVGHGTICKGVKLGTLVLRMKALYKLATGHDADRVANRPIEERRALEASYAAMPEQPTQARDVMGG